MGERVARETTPLPVESAENLNLYAKHWDAVLQTQIEIRGRHGVGVDLRPSAFVTAIKRVASVALARRIWP